MPHLGRDPQHGNPECTGKGDNNALSPKQTIVFTSIVDVPRHALFLILSRSHLAVSWSWRAKDRIIGDLSTFERDRNHSLVGCGFSFSFAVMYPFKAAVYFVGDLFFGIAHGA